MGLDEVLDKVASAIGIHLTLTKGKKGRAE
jgi:hypothetical protein